MDGRRVVPVYKTRHFTWRRPQYGLTPLLVIAGALSVLLERRRRRWERRGPTEGEEASGASERRLETATLDKDLFGSRLTRE